MRQPWRRGDFQTVKLLAKELRRNLTPAEQILWKELRNRQFLGLKFRRQHPIGPFIADFYCADYRLVIEIDGNVHLDRGNEDAARTDQLMDYGYQVIRFKNEYVQNHLDQVLKTIERYCSKHLLYPS